MLVTKTLLLVVQQGYQDNERRSPLSRRLIWDLHNLEPRLYAYDKTSGRLLAEIELPANASGAPMTYIAGGKQYVTFSIGGATIPEAVIALICRKVWGQGRDHGTAGSGCRFCCRWRTADRVNGVM